MTRLIDADEIVYEETLRCAGRTGNSTTYYTDYHVWVGDIDDIPTVDAFPVIRCKDCKYCKVYEVFGHTLPLCNRIKTMIADALEEDDYCSRAERKEE